MSYLEEQHESVRLQSLTEHLGDLRKGLFWSAFCIVIAFFVCFYFAEAIVLFLKEPILQLLPENQKELYYFGLTDQLYSYMKVSLVAALAVSEPVVFLQLWLFVKPALKPNEKKLALPFIASALLSFVFGLLIAYRWVLPYLFRFLLTFSEAKSEVPMLGLSEYLSLTLQLLLGTALVFEIPVVLALLGKVGVVNGEVLRQFRPQAYIGLSILAAFITPTPDAFTMILALIPLFVLYEVSVLAVSFLSSTKR